MSYFSSFSICAFLRELVIAGSEFYSLYFEVVVGDEWGLGGGVVPSMHVMFGHKRDGHLHLGI